MASAYLIPTASVDLLELSRDRLALARSLDALAVR